MIARSRLGILGGTLDPVHNGHLEAAEAARTALALDRVVIMPSRVPPHRTSPPLASRYHRFAMAALAIQGFDGLEVSDMELLQPGPTYTSDTLDRLHRLGVSALQIFFITGVDAFAEIETWHRYPDVLELANFVVIARPGHAIDELTSKLPALRGRWSTIDASDRRGAQPSIFLVDAPTPAVSSTAIRARLAAHQSTAGMVPPAVEHYITHHRLYGSGARGPESFTTADHLHGQD
jgi:nicotinate-nucleotide adenylyltransferase